VKLGSRTTAVSAWMLTHPKSTMRVLCMRTYLSSSHVTLLRGEFQPPNFSPIGLMAPDGLTLGSASYF